MVGFFENFREDFKDEENYFFFENLCIGKEYFKIFQK